MTPSSDRALKALILGAGCPHPTRTPWTAWQSRRSRCPRWICGRTGDFKGTGHPPDGTQPSKRLLLPRSVSDSASANSSNG